MFKDGECVQIIPTGSKSETGMILYRINRDFGVENDIFVDNAPEKAVYNTEICRVKRLAIMNVRATDPHSPWGNKAESVVKIVRGEAK